MTRRVLDLFFGPRLKAQTKQYLNRLESASTDANRSQVVEALKHGAGKDGPRIALGTDTEWELEASYPAGFFASSHGLITGATGSGKSYLALSILKRLLTTEVGICLVDPKGEAFWSVVALVVQHMAGLNPVEAERFRDRLYLIDLGATPHVPFAPYNILKPWPGCDREFFFHARADQLLDLLPQRDQVSLSGAALLKRSLALLADAGSPVTSLEGLLTDEGARMRLVATARTRVVATDFLASFANAPKQTVAALTRRVSALLAATSVRCALEGDSAPDFRALQDNGAIVLVNCAGENLSRSVRRLLQALVVGDLIQATFARRNPSRPFLAFIDECQEVMAVESLKDALIDLLCRSRSFGTHVLFLTQNLANAMRDSRMMNSLLTNIRWAAALRNDPSDCAFLASALPVSGRRSRPQTDPFSTPTLLTPAEERAALLAEMAALPDRIAMFWPKAYSKEAIRIATSEVAVPVGSSLQALLEPVLADAAFGHRQSRAKEQSPEVNAKDFAAGLAATFVKRRETR